jgi:integrase
MASLAETSLKQYNCAYKKWWLFCEETKHDFYTINIPVILKFLATQFKNGASYSSLNTLRSALALILGRRLSEDDRIARFLKGVFRLKPSLPKYQNTWDPNKVLDYLSSWYPNEDLPLDKLTKKMVALLALSTAQRLQTLSLIRLSNITVNASNIEILISDLIKTSAPGRNNPRLIIPFFVHREQICPGKTLSAYLDRTKHLRDLPQTDKLILTIKKPAHNASPATIGRWIKQVLAESGIDTNVFTAHSTRHASTSAANRKGVSLDLIKKSAGWTGNSLVFAKYYNRPLMNVEDNVFAEATFDY